MSHRKKEEAAVRRSDREVTDTKEIVQMLLRCTALSLAFGGETPYVVPLSFGVAQQGECLALYMHCAPEGEKLARMAADPHVAFAAYRSGPLTEAPVACGYSTDYESVCGSGVLQARAGRGKASGPSGDHGALRAGRSFEFEPRELCGVTVLRLDVQAITGKRRATQTP